MWELEFYLALAEASFFLYQREGEKSRRPESILQRQYVWQLRQVFCICGSITDSSLVYHLENAKAHGVTKAEAAAIITHAAFYAGWPKGWAVFRLAKEVWKEDAPEGHGGLFGLGQPNDAYAKYFVGQSYLNPVAGQSGVNIANVTFEPGCRNNWHIHKAQTGGGQLLLCTEGRGWYQEWGKEARKLHPGDAVEIDRL